MMEIRSYTQEWTIILDGVYHHFYLIGNEEDKKKLYVNGIELTDNKYRFGNVLITFSYLYNDIYNLVMEGIHE